MNITKDTPRKDITIQGIKATIGMPFDEGHQVTANEAAALNQTFIENVRNNIAARLRKAQEEGQDIDPKAVQSDLDAYAAEYEFGVRQSGGGGGRTLTPVEKAARDIASEAVKDALAANGYSITGKAGVGREKFNELRDKYAARKDVVEKAERRVADQADLADLDLSGI